MRAFSFVPVGVLLAVAPLVAVVAWVTTRVIDEHEAACVTTCFMGGVLLELLLHRLSRHSLGAAIRVDHFAIVAHQHSAPAFLRDYIRIASTLPLHARANMPGKVLLYHALELLTRSDEVLGALVVLISALGGLLVYGTVKKLLDERRVALAAMILYFVLPARISFLTSLNTVTPVLALGLLLLALRYLDTRAWPYAAAIGLLLYVTALFDPAGLAPIPLFVAIAVWHGRRRRLPRPRLRAAALPLAAFALAYVAMRWGVGFDLWQGLRHVAKDSATFNRHARPHYQAWLLPNLREFFVNTGWVLSLLAVVCLAQVVGNALGGRRLRPATLVEPAVFLSVALLAEVALLDLMGINRGEVSRLWLFTAVFLPMIAAIACAQLPSWMLHVVLASTLMQAIFTAWLVQLDFVGFYDIARKPLLFHGTFILDAWALMFVAFVLGWSMLAGRARRAPPSTGISSASV